MLDYLKIGVAVAGLAGIGGAVWCVGDLRADNAALEATNAALVTLAADRLAETIEARKQAKQQLRRERRLHAEQTEARDRRDVELAKVRPAAIDKGNTQHPEWMARLANSATQKLFDDIQAEAVEK